MSKEFDDLNLVKEIDIPTLVQVGLPYIVRDNVKSSGHYLGSSCIRPEYPV